MESLLDNPMKAVLYLKELTTIVQNQQSLIQTQRQRIDELERKVEDLIGENRQLREPVQYHHHPHQHTVISGQTPQPLQQQQHPSKQPQNPPPPPQAIHHPQHLQLVPTASPPTLKPSPGSPEPAEPEKRRSPACKSLVPQAPATLSRSVGLARKPE
ncbi:hypothetical protein DNTS_003530 [Danionella cerebrum]|uniref:Uncharacterized protein n=1 Tax=Danionella cerebrum TaxID=2873325 RepID=A0A553QWZ6_9TELE|nr:hypothetical protein DNTS_003530 [Danionella translucida]